MPELPEAETIARVLAQHLEGRRLADVGPLERVWRYGKCVLFDFADRRLIARLGMTGVFRLNGEPGIHTRQIFEFEGARLLYDDIRKFGRLTWTSEMPILGPDVLAMTSKDFAAKLALRARAIKPVLLDQSFVSGIGNIYADECLFAARIHPLTSANQTDARKLHRAIHAVLQEAIQHRGSTISDFRDPLGVEGGYQKLHRVYAREGKPCPRCGRPIVRAVVAQRGTHYCPACQPSRRAVSR